MSKTRMNEKGVTLVELLAVIIFIAIIGISVSQIIIHSLKTNDDIQIKNALRDEADAMMASLTKNLYETRESYIVDKRFETDKSILVVLKDPSKCSKDESGQWIIAGSCTTFHIGFETNKTKDNEFATTLYLKDGTYTIMNPNISIHKDSKIENPSSRTYEVTLTLQYNSRRDEKPKTQTFKNIIQTF